ncbi:MAG: SIS domain-containing protein [Acidobacteria bacterium]|nr:SIS domain-containing protein [Acidobacteriota bacterium]
MGPFEQYLANSRKALDALNLDEVQRLGHVLRQAWVEGRQVFICGNGGSAANAIHLANDLFYGISPGLGGMRVQALSANQAVMTCLANDVSYEAIFSKQLEVLARPGDVLIVLSGSGNSPNIVRALETGKRMGLGSYAILGYSGGKCLQLADHAIHVAIDDMQICEDAQLTIGHMLMQWLKAHPPLVANV